MCKGRPQKGITQKPVQLSRLNRPPAKGAASRRSRDPQGGLRAATSTYLPGPRASDGWFCAALTAQAAGLTGAGSLKARSDSAAESAALGCEATAGTKFSARPEGMRGLPTEAKAGRTEQAGVPRARPRTSHEPHGASSLPRSSTLPGASGGLAPGLSIPGPAEA